MIHFPYEIDIIQFLHSICFQGVILEGTSLCYNPGPEGLIFIISFGRDKTVSMRVSKETQFLVHFVPFVVVYLLQRSGLLTAVSNHPNKTDTIQFCLALFPKPLNLIQPPLRDHPLAELWILFKTLWDKAISVSHFVSLQLPNFCIPMFVPIPWNPLKTNRIETITLFLCDRSSTVVVVRIEFSISLLTCPCAQGMVRKSSTMPIGLLESHQFLESLFPLGGSNRCENLSTW
mmetsp:Transcript_24312/g.40304  ORF Transcript_24312/g.40304 Transcript_24312/m.40304 type:complete len:232 (-) Transcript_24312:633-1328(-)